MSIRIKENFSKTIPIFANGMLVIVLSAMTVNKFSPEFLNADVIINSVMSLQNITLFYWGQNRLINFMPLLASLFKTPSVNLYFVLGAASIVHYTLLLYFAKRVISVYGLKQKDYMDTKIFLIISFIFVVIAKKQTIFSIAIWHIEYSIPLLMISWAFFDIIEKRLRFGSWLVLATVLIVIATGMNYSITVVSCALIGAYVFYIKKNSNRVIIFTLISVFSFIIWNMIAKHFGNLPYSKFSLKQIAVGLPIVAHNLLDAFELSGVVAIVFCITIICAPCSLFGRKALDNCSRLESYIIYSIAAFCFFWMIMFTLNKWVEMNQFSNRYFTFIIYGLLTVAAFQTYKLLRMMGYWSSSVIAGGALILIIVILWNGFVKLPDFNIFKRIQKKVPENHELYSGDYWLVWPAVFRDMMVGKPAFGLAYRGEGNKEKVRAVVDRQILYKGHFSVLCLNDKTESCEGQISRIVGDSFVDRVVAIRDGVNELQLKRVKPATSLKFWDGSFASLPSNTGSVHEYFRVTNGKAGFLFYGPL